MMKRLLMSLALVAGLSLLVFSLALAVAAPVAAQDGHDDGDSTETGDDHDDGEEAEDHTDDHGDEAADDHADDHSAAVTDDPAVLRGAAVFATYCQACHGPTGEAIGTGPAFDAIEYDAETARDIILEGADTDMGDGVTMPAYSAMLDEAELDDLIAYLDTWAAHTTPLLPEPNIHVDVHEVPDYFGDAHEGAVIYAKFCNGCHGLDGEGRAKPKVAGIDFAPQTIQLVAQGHTNEWMPAFGAAQGGPLDDDQLDDLETYMATWELAEDDDPAGSGLSTLVLIIGVGALLVVGGVYIVRDRSESTAD